MTDREIRLSVLERRYVKAAKLHRDITRLERRRSRRLSRIPEQDQRERQALAEWVFEFDTLVDENHG